MVRRRASLAERLRRSSGGAVTKASAFWLLIFALALAAYSCGGESEPAGSEVATVTAEATPEPTSTATPLESPEPTSTPEATATPEPTPERAIPEELDRYLGLHGHRWSQS